MKIKRKRLFPSLYLAAFAVYFLAIPLKAAASQEPILVGHISYIEGKLFRYVPAEETAEPDWVLIRRDAPLGPPDILYSDRISRAEFIFPNNALVRIDSSTQIDVVAIANDLTELYMTAGTGRFYNKSSATAPTIIKTETAFGYVVAPSKTTFDLHVGEESVELTVLRGTAEFIHVISGQEQRYEVGARSFSLRADNQSVATNSWGVDDDWNGWNRRRDALWAQRARVRVEYLPPVLDTYTYVFDEYGIWERVYYDGARRFRWRPRVAVGWSPFRHGRWTVWFGTHVWIPFEPFGYVTHHYGQWSIIGGKWYWAPPRHRKHPRNFPGTHWHPGRVGWIHSGLHIGWFPLGPREIYYGHRRWGPHTRVAPKRVDHRHKRHAYSNNAIIVKKSNFYAVQKGGYTPVKDKQIIIKHARSIPFIDRTIIKKTKHRHRYTDVKYERKPHKAVITQIKQRKARIRAAIPLRASELKRKLKRIQKGAPRKGKGWIKEPVVTDRIVTIPDVDNPDVKFRVVKPWRERIRRIPKPVVEETGRVEKARKGKEGLHESRTDAANRRIEKARKKPRRIIEPIDKEKKHRIGKAVKKPPSHKPETTRPVVEETRREEKSGQDKEGLRKPRIGAAKKRIEKDRQDKENGRSKKQEEKKEEEPETQGTPIKNHKKRFLHRR